MKAHNHTRYWVEDETLYETYQTIRGWRYRRIKEVPGKPDSENADEEGNEIVKLIKQ